MLEEHQGLAVNCSHTNMSDKQRQPIINPTTTMAQMGPSNRGSSSTPNDNKINKDASNGAVTKSSRTPRYGGGRRRTGSKALGPKGDSSYYSDAGQNPMPYNSRQGSKSQNLRKYQNGQGNFETSTRQSNYNHTFDKVIKEDEFEAGSIFNPGSKKQNLSHLLNFQYEPRGNKNKLIRNDRNVHHGGTSRKGANCYTTRPKYNKEQYLQANCQFVVRKGPDYTRHLKDPDLIVEWDLIEQVRLKTTSDVPSCPICLYPPTTAKLTKCGHVYCWTCILHYLSLSDQKWRKCPICFESIRREDLKSVVSVPWKEFKTKDEIEMKLMRRERNSLFALPVTDYRTDIDDKGHPDLNAKVNSYSQLVLASPEQVHRYITSKEQAELETKHIELKAADDATICYVEEALNYLTERQAGIIRKFSEASDISDECEGNKEISTNMASSDSGISGCWTDEMINKEKNSNDEGRPRHTSSSSDGMSGSEMETEVVEEPIITAEDLDISILQPFNNDCNEQNYTKNPEHATDQNIAIKSTFPRKANETFYFYQSSDGQPIFLHALNVQMLVREYGTFEACPTVIKGIILEKDGSNMSEELRNKLRFLKHVPVTCSFEVAELELNNQIVSNKTRNMFSSQLEQRKRKRAQRARAEKRREKRIEVEENKLMGKYPGLPKTLRIESAFHFPAVGNTAASRAIGLPIAQVHCSSELDADSGSSRASSPPFGIQEATMSSNDRKFVDFARNELGNDASLGIHSKASSEGMSFSKMLREGAAKPANPASTMSKSETFPGFLSLYPTPRARKTAHSDSEPEIEGYVPPPPKQSIGDAIAQALEQSCAIDSTCNENSPNLVNQAPGKKKGKKFKGKKISLSSGAGPHL